MIQVDRAASCIGPRPGWSRPPQEEEGRPAHAFHVGRQATSAASVESASLSGEPQGELGADLLALADELALLVDDAHGALVLDLPGGRADRDLADDLAALTQPQRHLAKLLPALRVRPAQPDLGDLAGLGGDRRRGELEDADADDVSQPVASMSFRSRWSTPGAVPQSMIVSATLSTLSSVSIRRRRTAVGVAVAAQGVVAAVSASVSVPPPAMSTFAPEPPIRVSATLRAEGVVRVRIDEVALAGRAAVALAGSTMSTVTPVVRSA